MKPRAAFLILCLVLGGCQVTAAPTPSPKMSDPPARSVSDGVTSEEVIQHKTDNSPTNGVSVLRGRKGLTPDGVPYTYYSDGSGSVDVGGPTSSESWTIGCFSDKMDDKRKCTIKNNNLFISYGDGTTPLHVCIRYHDFPGKTGAIRLDSNAPIATGKEGCVPGNAIASSLWKAKQIRLRGVHWPYNSNRDADVNPRGLYGAHLIVVHMQKHMNSLSFD